MSTAKHLIAVAVTVLLISGQPLRAAAEDAQPHESPPELAWPPVTKECRPWTYWWWMGSAVNPTELTRHLETYRKAGMGGMHIVPIYGAKGWEDQYIDYLTPKWMEMLAHTVTEAKRLDLGIDMTTGTGWPFGGPWVGREDMAAKAVFDTFELSTGQSLDQPVRSRKQVDAALRALVAYSEAGKVVDLTDMVDDARKLNWTAPEGKWTLWAVFQAPTGQQVKRAAPGAEGNVLNPMSRESLMRYLARFDRAFDGYKADPPRAMYHDSFEYYGANWSAELFDEFQKRRGYDLREHLPALLGKGPAEETARVGSDYRETVADMMLERYITHWVRWAHAKGALTRNQAHGSPGNLLDLYAAADVPETESYGSGWIPLAGMELPPEIPANWGGHPHLLANKFASSAAHTAGKRLVGCEACTWLSEHFQVSLAQVKAQLDVLFTTGVNHVIFHGMAYSPREAGWPGWLFYASTNFAPSNSFWRDFPELTGYIARVQSFLQAGQPSNDVAVYFPIYDLWAEQHGTHNLLHYLQVHNSTVWLEKNLAPVHRAAQSMWDRGWGFDFISDRQIKERLEVHERQLEATGSSYRVLLVPACKIMPLETLRRIVALARDGATVVFLGGLPSDVPGLANAQRRREQLQQILATIEPKETSQEGFRRADVGQGRVLLGDDLETMLGAAGVRREEMTDAGVRFIRRVDALGWVYFVTNPSKQKLDGWIPLAVPAQSVAIFEPRLAMRAMAAVRRSDEANTEVYLQLAPGESLVLRAVGKPVDGPRWTYLAPASKPLAISGAWQVEFIEGGPKLPEPIRMEELESWVGDAAARPVKTDPKAALSAFSGTARYTISFQKPPLEADEWVLDLGRVCESARVKLNGKPLGTLFCRPFRVRLGNALEDGQNKLEVEVTNLTANRIIDMGRRGEDWAKFMFVYMTRRDPRTWRPLPSGLLGPVRLLPMKEVEGP